MHDPLDIREAASLPPAVISGQLDLRAALDRVAGKSGMAGCDGVLPRAFALRPEYFCAALFNRYAAGAYVPDPLRAAETAKKNGSRRLLLVPTAADRISQTALCQWLVCKWNARFDPASFAYRPGLGVAHALRAIAAIRAEGYNWVLDADIRSFFDSIPHDALLERLASALGEQSAPFLWLRGFIRAAVWDGRGVSRLVRGVPQGSPLSPLLANVYLDSFDRRIQATGGRLVRYADDFILLARTAFELARLRDETESALESLGLTLNQEKTRNTTFIKSFRFVGAEIRSDAILLPFEKTKTPRTPIWKSPVMPPSLLRIWRSGRMAALPPFEWASPPPDTAPETPRRDSSRQLELLRRRPA